MITMTELRKQLEEKLDCDEGDLIGENIRDVLNSLPSNVIVLWHHIPWIWYESGSEIVFTE